LLEFIDIAPTLQGEKKAVFTSAKINANTKEHMLSGWLAETCGYDNNFYKPLVNQLKRLVTSCN